MSGDVVAKHSRQSRKPFKLRYERLENRSLPCVSSFTLAHGVLDVSCGAGDDHIEVERGQGSTIQFRLNEHRTAFGNGQLRVIYLKGLEGNDLALIDTTLDLPMFVSGVKGGQTFGGWLVPEQVPLGGHHSKNGINHLVIAAEFLQTGRIATTLQSPADAVTENQGYLLGTSALAWSVMDAVFAGHEGHWFPGLSVLQATALSGQSNLLTGDPMTGHSARSVTIASNMEGGGLGTVPTFRIHKPG